MGSPLLSEHRDFHFLLRRDFWPATFSLLLIVRPFLIFLSTRKGGHHVSLASLLTRLVDLWPRATDGHMVMVLLPAFFLLCGYGWCPRALSLNPDDCIKYSGFLPSLHPVDQLIEHGVDGPLPLGSSLRTFLRSVFLLAVIWIVLRLKPITWFLHVGWHEAFFGQTFFLSTARLKEMLDDVSYFPAGERSP